MRREDTVVSSLPPSFDYAVDDLDDYNPDHEATNHASPRAKFVPSRTDAAIASLGGAVPPAPQGWTGQQRKHLRAIAPAEPPQTINDIPAAPRRAPTRSASPRVLPPPCPAKAEPLTRNPGGNASIMPIPAPCFEPSVVASMPRPAITEPAVEAEAAPTVAASSQGKVIVVFGCRGGAGATTLAVNTAADLVRTGKSVCIVDLDLQLGDVFVALDLEPTTSIAALAREASTIDAAALKRRLARHDSGVYALTQTAHVDDMDPALIERLPALMATLADHFDYVIVDGVRDFGDCALAALDMADSVAMVLAQDVASVRRAARAVKLFRRLGYSESKLHLVLNRAKRGARVGEAEIVAALGLAIGARIRNDFKKASRAFNDGALIGDVARGSGLAKDLSKLTTLLAGPTVSAGRATTESVEPSAQASGGFSLVRRLARLAGIGSRSAPAQLSSVSVSGKGAQ